MLNSSAIDQFQTDLRGALLQPDDLEYDVARKVYNDMIDRHPRLIARCADVADVIVTLTVLPSSSRPLVKS